MESFIDYIKKNIPRANIIHINFNDISWENICEYHDLNKYVLEHYESESENYLFIAAEIRIYKRNFFSFDCARHKTEI